MKIKTLFLVILTTTCPLFGNSESLSSGDTTLESATNQQACQKHKKSAEKALKKQRHKISKKITRLKDQVESLAAEATTSTDEYQKEAIQNKVARAEQRIKSLQEKLMICQKTQEIAP